MMKVRRRRRQLVADEDDDDDVVIAQHVVTVDDVVKKIVKFVKKHLLHQNSSSSHGPIAGMMDQLRIMLIPSFLEHDSASMSVIPTFDSQGRSWCDSLALLFIYSIARTNPEATWPRVLKSMIQGEVDIATKVNVSGITAASSQGLIERLLDRYLAIFKAIQNNRVVEISMSLKPRNSSSSVSTTSAYNISYTEKNVLYGTVIGFDASFALAQGVAPIGWSLVHFAAQSSSREMIACLVEECGLGYTEKDGMGRNPLHIAALALNMPVVEWLVDQRSGSRLTSMVDQNNKLPIQLLLHTLSVRDWTNSFTGQDILSMITKLLPCVASLWQCDEYLRIQIHKTAVHDTKSLNDEVLAHSLLYTVLYR